MDSRCRIELLGGLRLVQEGGARIIERFRTRKAAALLAYLALYGDRAQAREVLLEVFWPEMDEKAGRDNLSTALSSLRRQLEPPGNGIAAGDVLFADVQNVRLNFASVTTDVQVFERGIEAAARPDIAPEERAKLLKSAIAEYRGELLPGFYEDWALREQGRLAGRYADALEQWGRALAQVGDRESAVEAFRRCAEADPLREEARREQMRLLCTLGRPAAAREVYAELTRYLREEMDVAPAAATRRLWEQIEKDPDSLRIALPNTPERFTNLPPSPPVEKPEPGTPRVFLPLQLTRFVGREKEREKLTGLLSCTDEKTRLVTLLGPGGAGKTRLAIEAARMISPAYPGGVWFISLADIPAPAFLPSALASALQLPPAQSEDLMERIVAALNQDARPKLLVLDNFEHLLAPRFEPEGNKSENPALRGSPALVRLLLNRVPELSCLVTSRQLLGLSGEVEIPLGPLSLPQSGTTGRAELLTYASIALFVDRARSVVPDFTLNSANAAPVADLCRRLEGIPLAIEMAATWVKTLPPARLQERLAERVTTLASRRRDLPARHETLKGAIDWSYELLSPELQAAFRRLSVFRGGWSLDRAEVILGDDLASDLADLQDRSLVVVAEATSGRERYRLLEPLREYAAERLAETGESEEWREKHAAAYCQWAIEAGPNLRGPDPVHWLDLLEEEHDNLRVALDSRLRPAVSFVEREKTLQACSALFWLWKLRGHNREGRLWCRRALEVTDDMPPSVPRASVSNGAGHLFLDFGDMAQAEIYFQQAHDLYAALDRSSGVAVALVSLANLAYHRGDFSASRVYSEQALAIHRAQGAQVNKGSLATLLGNLGRVYHTEKNYERATELRKEALALQRERNDPAGVAIQLNNLGAIAGEIGNYVEARTYLREALTINQTLGNQDSQGYNLYALGETALYEGNYAMARGWFLGALRAWRQVDRVPMVATILESLARTEIADGAEMVRASRLLGAAETVRAGQTRQLAERPLYEEAVHALTASLGAPLFSAHFEAGRNLSPEEAAALIPLEAIQLPD